MALDYAVIVAYLLGMVGMGWWACAAPRPRATTGGGRRRAAVETRQPAGALASMVLGALTVVVVMITNGPDANEVIFYGLGVSLVSYVVVSLLTPPTPDAVRTRWSERSSGEVMV